MVTHTEAIVEGIGDHEVVDTPCTQPTKVRTASQPTPGDGPRAPQVHAKRSSSVCQLTGNSSELCSEKAEDRLPEAAESPGPHELCCPAMLTCQRSQYEDTYESSNPQQ